VCVCAFRGMRMRWGEPSTWWILRFLGLIFICFQKESSLDAFVSGAALALDQLSYVVLYILSGGERGLRN